MLNSPSDYKISEWYCKYFIALFILSVLKNNKLTNFFLKNLARDERKTNCPKEMYCSIVLAALQEVLVSKV